MTILAIIRAPQFSPNSIHNDRAIMQAVANRLRQAGHSVIIMPEEEVAGLTVYQYDNDTCMITMGRLPQTLAWLREQDVRIINTPEAVALTSSRSSLIQLMKRNRIPMPPTHGEKGFWIKRGDSCAQKPDDVIYCPDNDALEGAIRRFADRGIADYVVSAHVEGDLVKFYGVRDTGFFRTFYPTDNRHSKFGNERHNGPARHYPFSIDALHHDVTRLAAQVGIDVYGGDCIVRADGSYCIIDFNDWPSFSRCLGEAAKAIVQLIMERAV